ncbi:MAG: NAD-binding protein [Bacillota bacterium]
MTVMTTVGFGDIAPITAVGKIVTLVVAPAGLIAVFGLGLSVAEEHIGNLLVGERRRMEREIASMKDHYIVCGHGTLGALVVAELRRFKQKVVVIESDAGRVESLTVPHVVGNALEAAVLKRAGLERARAVLATFREDADNMYLILEVRGAAPGAEILTVASSREAARRMYLAGAKRVISPNLVGAELLAKSAVNPGVMQLVSDFTDQARVEQEITQVPVAEGSPLAGRRLRDLPALGLRVKVALIRSGERLEVAPAGDSLIPAGSVLVVAGNAADLAEAERLATPD